MRFEDPLLELLQEKGIEHEAAYLEKLEADGKQVVRFGDIPKERHHPEEYRRRAAETLEAMRSGADVIFQGTLFDGEWLGLVDFLIRVETPSDLGAWSYEVVDAKLTREAKATAILQTCVYSELLTPVQGREPEQVHLNLGGPRPRLESFRLAHFAAYYRQLKRRFYAHLEAAPDEVPVAPDPVESCGVCAWRSRCDGERRAVDHLSLVAGIARDHRRALEAVGGLVMDRRSQNASPTDFLCPISGHFA